MVLNVETDAAYLVLPKSKSRLAGYFYMGHKWGTSSPYTRLNRPILVKCKTISHIVYSETEVETARVFYNAQTCISMRRMIAALGHAQPPTPIKTDNATAYNFTYDNINQKKASNGICGITGSVINTHNFS